MLKAGQRGLGVLFYRRGVGQSQAYTKLGNLTSERCTTKAVWRSCIIGGLVGCFRIKAHSTRFSLNSSRYVGWSQVFSDVSLRRCFRELGPKNKHRLVFVFESVDLTRQTLRNCKADFASTRSIPSWDPILSFVGAAGAAWPPNYSRFCYSCERPPKSGTASEALIDQQVVRGNITVTSTFIPYFTGKNPFLK